MIRFLTLVSVAALIGSALYAYRVKYDTIFFSEQVAKMKNRITREQDAINTLRAEWQFLNKPDRVQTLTESHTDLVPLAVQRIVRWQDVPARKDQGDAIGAKIEALGSIGTTSAIVKKPDAKPQPKKTQEKQP
jgi:hypothetical protein